MVGFHEGFNDGGDRGGAVWWVVVSGCDHGDGRVGVNLAKLKALG